MEYLSAVFRSISFLSSDGLPADMNFLAFSLSMFEIEIRLETTSLSSNPDRNWPVKITLYFVSIYTLSVLRELIAGNFDN